MKIGLGIGIPRQQSYSGGGASFDTDYQALLDAASGDLPTEPTQTAQNTLVLDLKSASVWAKLDLFYVFATDGGDDIRRRNWITPASFQATLVSDPAFTSLEGYTGDASADYIDTNWVPATNGSNYTLNSASMGVYQRLSNSDNNYSIFGDRTNTSERVEAAFNRNTAGFSGINSAGVIHNDLAAVGLNYMNRASSTEFKIISNGSVFQTLSSTSSALPAGTIYIHAANNNPTPVNLSNNQISIFFAGASLESEAAAFFTAINKYMTAIGKNV